MGGLHKSSPPPLVMHILMLTIHAPANHLIKVGADMCVYSSRAQNCILCSKFIFIVQGARLFQLTFYNGLPRAHMYHLIKNGVLKCFVKVCVYTLVMQRKETVFAQLLPF